MTYAHAMQTYGNDKPDIRFGMEFGELNEVAKKSSLYSIPLVVIIAVPVETTPERNRRFDRVKRPKVLQEWSMKCNEDGTYKSSVDKFYDQDDLSAWAKTTGARR
jgi:aspartyl-tRNA synthetase